MIYSVRRRDGLHDYYRGLGSPPLPSSTRGIVPIDDAVPRLPVDAVWVGRGRDALGTSASLGGSGVSLGPGFAPAVAAGGAVFIVGGLLALWLLFGGSSYSPTLHGGYR